MYKTIYKSLSGYLSVRLSVCWFNLLFVAVFHELFYVTHSLAQLTFVLCLTFHFQLFFLTQTFGMISTHIHSVCVLCCLPGRVLVGGGG